MCKNSKGVVLTGDFCGKGSLLCLAIGQIVHMKGCFGAKGTGSEDILLIFAKGTWPNL